MSLITCKLPFDWKMAPVTPVPKSSCMADLIRYRPISLLPSMSQCLEKHIEKLILAHLDIDSMLFEYCGMRGFLKDRLTTGALLNIINIWCSFLENGHEVAVIFLDLQGL